MAVKNHSRYYKIYLLWQDIVILTKDGVMG